MLTRRLVQGMSLCRPATMMFSTDKSGSEAAEAFPIKFAYQSDLFKSKDLYSQMEMEMSLA